MNNKKKNLLFIIFFLIGIFFLKMCFAQQDCVSADGESCRDVSVEKEEIKENPMIRLYQMLEEKGSRIERFLLQDKDFLQQVRYGFIIGSRDKYLRKTTDIPSVVWDRIIEIDVDVYSIGGKPDCELIKNEIAAKICNAVRDKEFASRLNEQEKVLYLLFTGRGNFNAQTRQKALFYIGYSEYTPSEILNYIVLVYKLGVIPYYLSPLQGDRSRLDVYKREIMKEHAALHLGVMEGRGILQKQYKDEFMETLFSDLSGPEDKLAKAAEDIAQELAVFYVAKQEEEPLLCDLLVRDFLPSLCKDESFRAGDIQILNKYLSLEKKVLPAPVNRP
jgi:hypothetical protein